jgi:hypothetical protein
LNVGVNVVLHDVFDVIIPVIGDEGTLLSCPCHVICILEGVNGATKTATAIEAGGLGPIDVHRNLQSVYVNLLQNGDWGVAPLAFS